MTQYTDYGSIPQAVRDVVANKCHLLDQYILMQTGQTEYTALVRNPVTKEVKQYRFNRTNNYSQYAVTESSGTWDYSVTNEYYCYSNIGYGAALDLPVTTGTIAHSSVVITCAIMLAVVFKGVLFPCLRKR